MHPQIIAGVLLVLTAPIYGIVMLVRRRQIRELEKVGVWTTGVVVIGSGGDDGNIAVEFVDEDGKQYTAFSTSSSSFLPREGEEAEILYDPQNPWRSEVEPRNRAHKLGGLVVVAILVALGVFFLIIDPTV